MSQRKKDVKATSPAKDTVATLQKRQYKSLFFKINFLISWSAYWFYVLEIASMKMINKELVVNIQRLKKDVANSASQSCSLKAELYDMITEKNSLMVYKFQYFISIY